MRAWGFGGQVHLPAHGGSRKSSRTGGVRGIMGRGEIVRIILESLLSSRSLGDKSLNY